MDGERDSGEVAARRRGVIRAAGREGEDEGGQMDTLKTGTRAARHVEEGQTNMSSFLK